MNRKPIRFILAVSAKLRRYNNTLYNILYYIQTGGKTRTELSDSLHRILSEQRPEKTCRKKTSVRKKTRQEIWVGSMAHALKSPSYEGYTAGRSFLLFTKVSNKGRQTLNHLRNRKQAQKTLRNSNCH